MELWNWYRFCPRCGAEARVIGAPPFECGECGFLRFFNPACAVAAFVIDPNERALFIRRAREPSKGKLGLPGGFVDSGENAEEALRREVFEEVGVELNSLAYLGSWPNRYPTPHGVVPVCDLFFVARVDSNRTTPAASEVSDIVWAIPADIDAGELAFDSMRAALDAIVRRAKARSNSMA
jgi:NAD+ diphosphatase